MVLSFLILPIIFHVTLSYDESFWCGKVQEEVLDVWTGQNISMRFYLEDPMTHVQTLMWRKGESIWVKRHDQPLEYDGYGDFEVDRYRLTEVSNVTFNLFIGYTEQNDSGHHVVTLNQGSQPLCLALLLNLTVETPEPICSTKLNNRSRKLKMYCEWLQMNEGDQAHFEVDNEILYHQIPELNFNGSLNMTHQFSVYVGLDKILDEITVPKKCIVTHRKGKAREMCEFPVVTPHPIEYTNGEKVDFECCVAKPRKPTLLVYDGDGNKLSVDSKRNFSPSNARDADCILYFLCGSNEAVSEITILNVKSLDVRKHATYESLTVSLHVADLKLFYNKSREDEQCEVITVNFTSLDSTLNNQEGISPESAIDQTCVHPQVTRAVPSITSPCGITSFMDTYLLPVLVVSTIAHGVSIVAFVFSYRRA